MDDIVINMAGDVDGGPIEPSTNEGSRIQLFVAIGSLGVLVAGVVGSITSIPPLAAFGICFYGLVGFGAAILTVFGYRNWDLLSLSAPLGLGLLLVTGAVLSSTGIWVVGPTLFWIAAIASAYVHASVIYKYKRSRFNAGRARSRKSQVTITTAVVGQDDHVRSGRARRSRQLGTTVIALCGLGMLLCLVSALSIKGLDPGWGGLLAVISPAWYVGLFLLLVAIVVGQRVGGGFAAIGVIGLQLCLTGTPALVYNGPRYAWTVKQVGETAFILLHGFARPTIDIYQAWPGLFSATAWLCHVATFQDPLVIARWWPPVIDLATLLVVHRLASRVFRDPRRAWLAAALFAVGYTIGDSDYFSSQSAAYLLAIAIFGVVYRHRDEKAVLTTSEWFLLLTLSIAEAVTHQLTPYMATAALAMMTVFGRSKTRWAPVITLAPAVLWALAHFAYVTQHVSFSALFNIFGNLATPGASVGGPAPGALANTFRHFQIASALLIGILALAALVRYRTSTHVFLAACAVSAGALVAANSYGNEADFRVVLFALPWLVIMGSTLEPSSRSGSVMLWSAILVTLLPVYLEADMGLDFVYSVRTSDLAAVRYFETYAPKGSVEVIIGESQNQPINLTGRFNLVNETSYSHILGFSKAAASNPAVSYQQFMSRLQSLVLLLPFQVTGPTPEYYVLFTRQEAAYSAAYNYATLAQYQGFAAQFANSSLWQTVVHTKTADLFRLRSLPNFQG